MRRISREQAVAEIEAARRAAPGAPSCLVCRLLDGAAGAPIKVASQGAAVVVVPRYGVRRGHLMVALRPHITRLSQLPEQDWLDACALAHAAARACEGVLAPLRCYVASLGTPRTDLPMTSPHLHLHVIPVVARNDRPAEVLTWQHGVMRSSDDDRQALREALRACWPGTVPGL